MKSKKRIKSFLIMKICLILISVLLFISNFFSSYSGYSGWGKEQLKLVKQDLLLKNHEYEKLDSLSLSLKLREYVYNNVRLEDTPSEYVLNDDYFRIYNDAINLKSVGHICAGITVVYAITLRSFGLKVRKVSLFDNIGFDGDLINSHATLDVLIDGKWIAMDATFNTSLRNMDGEYLSYFDAKDTMYIVDQGTNLSGRALEDYYIPLNTLLNYMYASYTEYSDEIFFPSTWDGQINANGELCDITREEFWETLIHEFVI